MAQFQVTLSEMGQGRRFPIGESHVLTVFSLSRVRLIGMFFELNKCFLLPSAMRGIREVKRQYDLHPNGNVLVVGHTDTSGNDDYNLTLSLERADGVAAYLTDNVDAWDNFFSSDKPDEKRWGTREIQYMLSALPEGAEPGEEFFSAKPNGVNDVQTQAAVRKFQKEEGLNADGIVGPITRNALITRYMSIDATTLPAGITITTHGCGENFSVDDTGDGVRDQANRRVEIFFFDGAIQPAPPGSTSMKGSPEYPAWVAQVDQNVDISADPGPVGSFQYGISVGGNSPWTANAVLRITSVDGSDDRKLPVQQGRAAGNYRIMDFPNSIPGLKYQGFIEQDSSSIQVFGAVELFRLVDPEDGVDHLPLPEINPPADAVPPAPLGPPNPVTPQDPEFDASAVAFAADPSLPENIQA